MSSAPGIRFLLTPLTLLLSLALPVAADTITLKNGSVIQGQASKDEAGKRYEIVIAGAGTLFISVGDVEKVEPGEIAPAPESDPPATPEETPEKQPTPKPETPAKVQPFAAAVIPEGVPVDELAARVVVALYADHEEPLPSAELVETIEFHVRELGRHRTRNRVRAEAHLERIGTPVLPYLAPVALHPLNLSRRAVQRIIGGIGDESAVPLAIAGLDDRDRFVREAAHEALKKILRNRVKYRADWSARRRQAAQATYWEIWSWREHERMFELIQHVLADMADPPE